MKLLSFLLLLWLFPGMCLPDELPDSPKPQHLVENIPPADPKTTSYSGSNWWDLTNKIEFGAMVGLSAWDMGQTCDSLSHGGREYWLTQSCGKNIAITAGIDAATVGLAWLLHRSGHHRLERIPMLWKAGDSLHGIIFSRMHGGT